LREPFPILVQGVDARGRPFRADTVIENLSVTGLYVRLEHEIMAGARLSMILHMAPTYRRIRAARVAALGIAARTESLPDGKFGVGVSFTQHRVL
jgi:hypothetical protein